MKNTKEYASDPEVEYTISEEWKQIDGFEGLYAVSSKGRVMNLKSGKVLKNKSNNHGYPYVALPKGDGKSKNMLVHRLVAQAFIPNPLNLPEVNHRNEIKTDNDVNNLEWVSRSENVRYSIYKQSCRINQLSLDGEFINQWDSSKQIERELGFDHGYIIACCKGKYNQAYGFRWEYADGLNQQRQNRPVAALTKDGEFVSEYKSAAEASRCLKICVQAIHFCLKGTCKSTHGLRFIYID